MLVRFNNTNEHYRVVISATEINLYLKNKNKKHKSDNGKVFRESYGHDEERLQYIGKERY
jgi:hypothetical protein